MPARVGAFAFAMQSENSWSVHCRSARELRSAEKAPPLIIFEMTGGYGLVLPLMLANMTSYALARRLRTVPVYEALLAQDGIELAHANARVHPLERLTVANAMTSAVRWLSAERAAGEAAASLVGQSFAIAPILDRSSAVIGAVSLADLRLAASLTPDVSVQSLRTPVQTIRASEPLLEAIVRMTDQGVRQLCVVSEGREPALLGIVAISDVVHVHARAAPGKPRRISTPNLASAVRAVDIMREGVLIDGATKLSELKGARACFIVSTSKGYSSLFPQDLADFARDDNLSMLTVADVARPAPVVVWRASLEDMTRTLHKVQASALTVLGADGPVGMVSRADLASALLEWYALAISAPNASGLAVRVSLARRPN